MLCEPAGADSALNDPAEIDHLELDYILGHGVSHPGLASYRLSLGASLLGALLNAVFGLLVTWVLVRYRFPGKRLLNGLVDLPFALPTAVAGIALTTLYATNGWIGWYLDVLGQGGMRHWASSSH